MGPSVKYPRASHTNGPARQPPTPLWPLPRVILGNYKLPGLHPELDILIQVQHTVFIDTPSQPYRSKEPGSVKILEGAENLQGGVSRYWSTKDLNAIDIYMTLINQHRGLVNSPPPLSVAERSIRENIRPTPTHRL